jgi:hypothetical protein
MASICLSCETRPALVCQECMRALTLIDQSAGFGGISRHPEAGRDCRICEHGAAAYCPECFCEKTLEYRRHLLEQAGWSRATREDLDEQQRKGAEAARRVADLNAQAGEPVAMAAGTPVPVPLSWGHALGR